MIKEENYVDLVEELKKVKQEILEASEKTTLKAKIAYKKALRKAQANFKKINKSGYNPRFGKNGNYATYEDICDAIHDHLAKEGITFDHRHTTIDGVCYLETEFFHDMGHSEYSYYPLSPTSEINLSLMQQIGGGNTYGKKYNLSALSGMSKDGLGDDDAEITRDGDALVSKAHVAQLKKVLREVPPQTEQSILDGYEIDSLEKLKLSSFEGVYKRLKEMKEGKVK